MTIADLKPYPAMKDSGLRWLGAIPASWSVVRNGRLFAERKETGFADLPILEVSLRSGVRVRRFGGDARKQLMSDRDEYKRACAGDLAYNMMRMWQGAVGLAPVDGLVSPAYVVARPFAGVVAGYFAYLFRTGSYMGEVDQYSRGIVKDRNRLYWDQFRQLPSACPPAEEQAAIVRFLAHVDRQIRRYIQAKQRLINLLEDQKQAIIHCAVTHGLEPNVHLKPSGVKWLGDVPEHWEVAPLRLRYSQCLGKMLDSKRIRGMHTVPYLRNADVQWDRVNTSELPVMDIAPNEYERHTVKLGDLLVCEGGEIGRSAIWSGELDLCGFQKALHRLRPLSPARDVPRFLLYVFRVATREGAFADGHESTIAHLTGDKLRAHRFPFPPNDEQRAIVAHLDPWSQEVDRAVTAVNREIGCLREYRTHLIANIVTGKLDVRVVAATLPDEDDEAEAPDDTVAVDADEGAEDLDSDAALEEDEA